MEDNTKVVAVKDVCTQPGLEWTTERAVRHLLFKAKTNGLAKSGAIIKLGRRTLIDVARFSAWVNEHRVQQ
ncbi:MAG: hypothetical protein EBR02_02325 [Alphaproteobacteria bacterium]|nr:hypothetical protein [Alphaproteobacteria bacterium]